MEWIMELRQAINDTISLIEITLNQIYTKAEYDPLDHWQPFDKEKLGDKEGQRFWDKINWVWKISGQASNIEEEKDSLKELKNLRNHFNHFDPPSLAITLEEATRWLNQIIDVGFILIKFRKALKVNVSTQLINFILQEKAEFCPEPFNKERIPLDSTKVGYYSTTWPN